MLFFNPKISLISHTAKKYQSSYYSGFSETQKKKDSEIPGMEEVLKKKILEISGS